MEKLTELMIITMEECGELTQACSKVLRTDFKDYALQDLKQLPAGEGVHRHISKQGAVK